MDVEITHSPAYAHLNVELEQGESILTEPRALVGHSSSIGIETTSSRDGLLSSEKSMAVARRCTATTAGSTSICSEPVGARRGRELLT